MRRPTRVRWNTFDQDGTKLAVLVSGTTPDAYRRFLRAHDVPYFQAGEDRVDLRQAVDRLGEVLGVDRIVSDAGGVLNGALLRAGLIDEIDIQFLPAVVGRADAPALFEGYEFGATASPGTSGSCRRKAARTGPSSSGTASSRTSSRNEEARGEPVLLSFWQGRIGKPMFKGNETR